MHDTALTVVLPRRRKYALRWACDFVFDKNCVEVHYELHDTEAVRITDGHRELLLRSVFPDLGTDRESWRLQAPVEPLARFAPSEMAAFGLPCDASPIPVLYGAPEILQGDDRIDCKADLFGGIFFMLSRFEEIISPERDAHDRFPGAASLAHRENFLQQPLADIYRHLILSMVEQLWPGWRHTRERGRIQISCDVDEPFDRSVRSPRAFIRTLGGDILKRRSASLAVRRTLNYALRGVVGTRFDPCYTFEWYMDQCEAAGLRATFYFIAGNSAGLIDGTYQIEDARILKLFAEIAARGHRIGMHGSYLSFRDPNRLRTEREALVAALAKAGLDLEVRENRQHYLRWDASCTPDHLQEAGFRSDASGGFADLPGFRYGTARQFRMWSWRRLRPLNLIQKPLIVMEGTLLSSLYLGLDDSKALAICGRLRERAEQYGGEFGLLWHNSSLLTACERYNFEKFIAKSDSTSRRRWMIRISQVDRFL